jgi:hypothetical protein
MTLEDSTGAFSQPTSVDQVTEMVSRLGSGLEHLILDDGDMYVQTAQNGSGFVVEYHDASGHYVSTNQELPREEVIRIFTLFFNRDGDWKRTTEYSLESAAQPSADAGRHTTTEAPRSRSMTDSILGAAQREAQSSLLYGVRRVLRRLFRKLF